jgi:methionine biosynthesis protein MetW
MQQGNERPDYRIIADIIEPGAQVLDLGCGSGDLMRYLVDHRKALVQGIELDEDAIYQCVEKGLSVIHSDIDSGLSGYPDGSFDYIILNQSLQEVKKIDFVLAEAMRVGRKVIVGFPNFACVTARVMLFFSGRAPVTDSLPYHWNDTPNIRFLSIDDFRSFCDEKSTRILDSRFLGKDGTPVTFWPNLFAVNAIFVVTKS